MKKPLYSWIKEANLKCQRCNAWATHAWFCFEGNQSPHAFFCGKHILDAVGFCFGKETLERSYFKHSGKYPYQAAWALLPKECPPIPLDAHRTYKRPKTWWDKQRSAKNKAKGVRP